MLNRTRQLLVFSGNIIDQFIVVFSLAVAMWFSFLQSGKIPIAEFLAMRIKISNFLLFILYLVIWYLVFSLFGLYRSRRFYSALGETGDIFKATSVGTFLLGIGGLIFDIQLETTIFILVFWIVSTFSTILFRGIARRILARIRHSGRNLRYMLIVGSNRRAIQFANKITAKKELGYIISGFVDDHWEGIKKIKKFGHKIVSDLKGFQKYINEHVVDEVVIVLPIKSYYYETLNIATICEQQGIIVRFIPSIFDLELARSKVESFEGDYVITFFTGHYDDYRLYIKRIFDFIVASILFVFCAPILLIIAILIKITSPGPVFFIQDRVGLNKRRFKLYKFRTMIPDAEKKQAELEALNEQDGPVFKIKNDPRLTKIGHILRKTSIDELPQLINVLKGDMSLVGPRPLPVRDYKGFNIDWHRRRFSVRPGVTCLWQANGRNNITFAEWMELDMEYIDTWSLKLDMKILAKTLPAVLKGTGAA